IAVITGPNLAKEIARREPAASVVACEDEAVALQLQKYCHTPAFRPYTNTDVVGCELAGTVKNIIGLAVGVCDGLDFGDNTKASVITRGLAETARLGLAMGADPMTFMGLAGLGDLVATCSSPLSRNRTFGEKLGRGVTVDEITPQTRQGAEGGQACGPVAELAPMHRGGRPTAAHGRARVAEGVKSCVSVAELAQMHGVDMPIVAHVRALVDGEMTPTELVEALISRSTKPEMR